MQLIFMQPICILHTYIFYDIIPCQTMSELCLCIDLIYHVLIITGFYPSPKSFWSCTHVNSFQKYALYVNLHILLNI